MTENGTFIINGTERVIVSQLHRSPGVFFERQQAQGYFLGKIIPYRGSWVEFEYDNKNLLHVRIDRKRKFYGTVFLRALGLKTDADILRAFYKCSEVVISGKKLQWKVTDALIGHKLSHAITKGGDTIATQGRKITASVFKEIQKAKVDHVEVAPNDLEGAYVAADVIDTETGEVLIEANHELTPTIVGKLMDAKIPSFEVFFPELDDVGNVISMTLRKDGVKQQNDALLEIYRKLRPGRSADCRHRHAVVPGHVLRRPQVRFLARRAHEVQHQAARSSADATPLDKRTLDHQDFIDTIQYLLKLRKGIGIGR